MAGMVYSTCMDNWSEVLGEDDDLSEEENDEFLEAAEAGLTSFMTLLGIEAFCMEDMFDMLGLDNDEDDCEYGECNCCEKSCGNCDCNSCSDNVEENSVDKE